MKNTFLFLLVLSGIFHPLTSFNQCNTSYCQFETVSPADCPVDACVICLLDNLNGYADKLGDIFSPCGNLDNFCGPVEVNQWFAFVVNDSIVEFSISPVFCEGGSNGTGLKAAIFATDDCSSFTPVSNCWNPGSAISGTVAATNLTLGKVYYLMIGGWTGDNCFYSIDVIQGLAPSFNPPIEATLAGATEIPDSPSNYIASYKAESTDANRFRWTIEPPSAGNIIESTLLRDSISILWQPILDSILHADLCVQPSNGCGMGLITCLSITIETGLNDLNCEDAIIACQGLDEISGILDSTSSPSMFLGCLGNSIDNPDWYAFVAETPSISMEIIPSSCSSLNGLPGIQGGIYYGCPTIPLATHCLCSTTPIIFSYDSFIPGNTYYLLVDGCAGDVCEYNINILQGSTNGVNVLYNTTPDSCNLSIGSASFEIPNNISTDVEYVWSTGDTTSSITSLSYGDYSVTVSFGNGCIQELSIPIDSLDCIVPVEESVPTLPKVTIIPNPNNGHFTLIINIEKSIDDMEASIIGINGRDIEKIFTSRSFQSGNHRINISDDHLSPGIYFLKLRSSNNSNFTKFIKTN